MAARARHPELPRLHLARPSLPMPGEVRRWLRHPSLHGLLVVSLTAGLALFAIHHALSALDDGYPRAGARAVQLN